MKLSEIVMLEARKNPDQNPKISINSIINNKLETTDDSIAGVKNLFVSFTAVDKLGINPQSHLAYDTPIGIYAYPASYVKKIVGSDERMSKLPFAGSQRYVNTFSATGNIINVATIDQSQVMDYYNKLDSILVPTGVDGRKRLRELIERSSTDALFPSYPGGQFWYVTMQLVKQFPSVFGKSPPIGWNKLMRMIGIDGVVDPGVGIIHVNEPTQAVFFSIRAVVGAQRHINSYSDQQQKASAVHGDLTRRDQLTLMQQIRAETNADAVLDILKDKGWKNIRFIKDEKIRQAAIDENPYAIRYITKPTDREQEIALNYDFISALTLMQTINPTILINALRDNYSADKVDQVLIQLPNVSEQLQVELVKLSPRAIKKIKTPSKLVVQTAIDNWVPPVGSLVPLKPGQLPKWLNDIATKYGVR